MQALFNQAPNYERVIQAGKDARHLWFTLREWRGDDPEGYFGDLGAWAERRMKELGVDSVCTITDRLPCSTFDILPDSNNLPSTNSTKGGNT